MPEPQALLLDIEGTTTAIDFVYGTLFPFARDRMGSFLEREPADAALLQQEHAADTAQGASPPPGGVAYVHWLMDRDRKSTGLKSLQGKVWEEGYRSGELRGQVYDDVPRAFARWKRQGRRIAIFSSGSVLAQKLLFAHSTAGDLAPFIEAYFDTTTGPKREAESYRRIAAALGLEADRVLFVSDVAEELEAAAQAGMATALGVRSGEAPAARHPVIRTFDELLP